jgi:hypothetical protein
MSRIPRLMVGMALLSMLVGHSRGEPGGKPRTETRTETRPVERVEVRGDGGRRQVEGVAIIEPPPLAEADNSCGHIQQRAGGWFRGEVRKRSLWVPSKNFYPSTQIGAGSSEADFSSD